MNLEDVKIIPLDREKFGELANLLMLEKRNIPDEELMEAISPDFAYQLVTKRIEALELNIKITPLASLTLGLFADRPGFLIFMIIDILSKLDAEEEKFGTRKEITVERLCLNFYPNGFYHSEQLSKYIESEVKTKKHKYSYIY